MTLVSLTLEVVSNLMYMANNLLAILLKLFPNLMHMANSLFVILLHKGS